MKKTNAKTVSAEQALIRLEAQCAGAEHCTFEIQQKLRRWKIISHDAEKIIESLKSRNFLNDNRFAKAYVSDKAKFAKWGQRKIIAGLLAKHIDYKIINTCIEQLDPEIFTENLLHLLKAKAAQHADTNTYEGRTRLYRYALSRGYLPKDVSVMIRKYFV